jgi:uncharacterized protein (TIGR02588 family)
MSEPHGRNAAEWTTLIGSCLILMVVTALIVAQMRERQTPPAPVATVDRITAVGSDHHVRVVVTNEGRRTAANVQVSAELVTDGDTATADQTIDFLAGGEEEDLVFVCADDPRGGDLTVAVTGFSLP